VILASDQLVNNARYIDYNQSIAELMDLPKPILSIPGNIKLPYQWNVTGL
jgi:hypothetical protein